MTETAGGTTQTGTTTAGGTTTTQAGTPWYQGVSGVDSEMVGQWTTKGWHTLSPQELAVQATKSWKEAERHIGVPSDEIVRLGKQPTPEQLTALYDRLGRPKEAAGYDLSNVKFKDGTALDDAFAAHIRAVAFQHGLSASAGVELAKSLVTFAENADAAETAETAAAIATERQSLAKNWGTTPEKLRESPHMIVAQNAVRALGIDPEAINALESTLGYAKVMEMFRTIGSKIGEDRFITGDGRGRGDNGVMTRDQAVARKNELKGDKEWVKKFLSGDVTAKREMEALDRLLIAGQTIL